MFSTHDGPNPSSSAFGGSPFRTFFQRSPPLPPKLQALLRSFDLTLQHRFNALMPTTGTTDVILTLSWMTSAVESLSHTHLDIKSLVADLDLPPPHSVDAADHHMLDMYLDSTVRLLDLCIAIASEISRLQHGELFLHYALHSMDGLEEQRRRVQEAARRSLRDWVGHVGSGSTKLGNALAVLQGLVGSIHGVPTTSPTSSRLKRSAKAKVLVQAMYGVKVQTIFVCGVLAAALSGSEATLMDIQVPDRFLWSRAFRDLRDAVYAEITRASSDSSGGGAGAVLLREFQAVYVSTHKLLTAIADCGDAPHGTEESLGNSPSGTAAPETKEPAEVLKELILPLRDNTETLSVGMDKLSKQVGGFFQIVLNGRDALLSNLRMPSRMPDGPDTS